MSLATLVVTAVRVEGRTKAEVARGTTSTRGGSMSSFAGSMPKGRPASSRGPAGRGGARTARWGCSKTRSLPCARSSRTRVWMPEPTRSPTTSPASGEGSIPSVATIWRILSRRGFVTPQPQKRPRSSYVRFAAEMPNERWQADITHWTLAGGAEVEILNVLDDHSRFLVASDARVVFKAADVVATFHGAAAAHGFPHRCSPITARCSPRNRAAGVAARSRSRRRGSGSVTCARPRTTADLREGGAVPPDGEEVAREA